MHKIQTMLILALLMVPAVSRAQYDTYIWKADSLYMFGEFAQSSAMFDKAFQTGQPVEGRHLYNAACVAALAGDKDVAFKRLFARMKKAPNWYADGISDDKDLFSLHDDARWKTFLDSLSARQERVERHYDKPLRKRLQEIGKADQDIRQEYIKARSAFNNQTKTDSLLREMQRIDSLTQAEICDILDKRGFVGREKVGDACAVFWLVIQHAPVELERKYLPEFQKAAARGDVAPSQVAMMEDRINMFEGKPQKYGSQIEEGAYGARVVYTLLNPEKVDVWRKEVGLEPLADYLRNMGASMPVSAEVLNAQRELLQQGDSCMKQYNTFEALKYYQQAFDMADNYEARTKLGDCYYKRGNYRQTADLLKLVPEDSLSHDAFRQLAQSYQKQGDTDSYIYWAGQLLGHFPMDGEIVAGLTLAYAKTNQPQRGIICGMKYSQRDSANILVNRALADAWFMNRDFTAANKLYGRLLEQGDSTFNTLYSAGMCYSQLEDLERAYHYLQLAFLISGMQHYGCAYRLGVVCIDTKRYPEGLGYLDLAKQLMQPDTTVMKAITLSQGEGYYLTQHYEEAVAAWKEHLAYNPSSIATYYNIGNVYAYILRDQEQARNYYQQFLDKARQEENPTPQLTEMMGKAREMLK